MPRLHHYHLHRAPPQGQGETNLHPGPHPIHGQVVLLVAEPVSVCCGQGTRGRFSTEVIGFGLRVFAREGPRGA
jgi:hypothetical protein